MRRIGIISDTHGWLDPQVLSHFKGCDEIWHAGDFGNIAIAEQLAGNFASISNSNSLLPNSNIKGVYGNIDGQDVRTVFPEKLFFNCEDVKIFMVHIGGYPGRYAPGIKNEIITHKPNLFISGHSHILKVMYDDKLNCLHINPGAAGRQGWQVVRTVIRLVIDGNNMKDCEVIELGKR